MKFVYLSGLLAAFLLLSACAPKTADPPTAPPEQETTQPQEPTPTPEQDPYEPFLAEKAYLTGEEFPYGPPIGFCRRDLDGDGKDELILLSDTFAGFGSLWVYTAPEGKVVEVPVDVDSMPQFFGTVKYSPAENALVYTDIRPSVNAGGYGFHRMENGALAVVSSVTWSEVCAGQVMYTHRKDGKNISITAEEKDNLLAETQALDITPLG